MIFFAKMGSNREVDNDVMNMHKEIEINKIMPGFE